MFSSVSAEECGDGFPGTIFGGEARFPSKGTIRFPLL